MNCTDISWIVKDGYPLITLKIDGKPALIMAEQKPSLINAGIVFLGSKFEKSHSVEFRGQVLKGFTNDRQFFEQIYLPFAQACNKGTFEEGDRPSVAW